MKRRLVACLIILSLCFSVLGLRLFYVSNNDEYASIQSATRVKDIDKKRGNIYDCNGELLVNNEKETVLLIKPDISTFTIISEIKGKDFVKDTLMKGYFTVVKTNENVADYNNSNIAKVNTVKRFSDSTAVHLIGYTDSSNNGVCGIEKYYNEEIKKYNGNLSVAFSADALGRMLVAEKTEIRDNNYTNTGGINLTIDKTIQIITENALKNGNISKGAAVVLEVETAAIKAVASTPIYDRNNLELSLNDENLPFINRAFSPYPVGSVFKTVTAISALENNIEFPQIECNGYTEKSGNIFHCNKRDGHGVVDFKTALSQSCNTYFIELGTNIGGEALIKTAKKFGFGKAIDIGNGYMTDSGTLPDLNDLNSKAAIGNFSFGQGKLTATPLQIASFYCVIANGGIYNKPFVYNGFTDFSGEYVPSNQSKGYRLISKQACKTIAEAMLETAKSGTGKMAYSPLFQIASKTATAQSGIYDKNGNEINYSWFVGFFPYENPKYVICIMKENGSSGGIDGAPVFKEISENIYKYENNWDIS